MRKDVRFGLVDGRIVQAGDVQADPMGRAMDVRNETKRHERRDYNVSGRREPRRDRADRGVPRSAHRTPAIRAATSRPRARPPMPRSAPHRTSPACRHERRTPAGRPAAGARLPRGRTASGSTRPVAGVPDARTAPARVLRSRIRPPVRRLSYEQGYYEFGWTAT